MDKGPDEVKTQGEVKVPNVKLHERLPQSFWNFSDKNADVIQREIRTTRAELDETVQAIQHRLAPQQFINQFADMARDVVRQGSPKVLEAIRNNPLPASLVVVGLGWLFIRGSAGPQPRVRRGYGRYGTLTEEEEYGLAPEGGQYSALEQMDMSSGGPSTLEKGKEWTAEQAQRVKGKAGEWTEQAKEKTGEWSEQAKGKAQQWSGQAKEKASQWAGQAKDKAGHLADQAKETVGSFADQAREKAGQMASQMASGVKHMASQVAESTKETASHWAGATRSKAGELAHSTMEMTGNVMHLAGEQTRNLGTAAQGQLKRAGSGTYRAFQENPGAFALLCIGVGAALAMGMPVTRKEQELMGEQSEALKKQALETGQQALGKVENIVEAGRQAAMEEARQQDVI